MAYYLGITLANIATTINPEIIIVGGNMTKTPGLIPKARQHLKKMVIFPSHKNTKVAVSKFGPEAGLIGAALITQDKYIF